ncbi:MAG: hypothetical protein U1A27_00240 [Phycisphaerae bacterium]
MSDDKRESSLESWAIVEVMGHSRYAGWVQQVPIGGAAMIRVDVPELPAEEEEYNTWEDGQTVKKTRVRPGMPAYTKYFGVASIYSITPCDEAVARAGVRTFRSAPATILAMPSPRALPAIPDDDDTGSDDDE